MRLAFVYSLCIQPLTWVKSSKLVGLVALTGAAARLGSRQAQTQRQRLGGEILQTGSAER